MEHPTPLFALAEIDYAGWASVAISIVAFAAVVVEYRRQTRAARLQLAQQMIERLDGDELIRFAVTALDWGAGLVIIPETWRDVVGYPSVPFDAAAIADAVQPNLTPATADDPRRLLYRHAFVHLFNHLERVGTLADAGAIDVADLAPMAELVRQLLRWSYAPQGHRDRFFLAAMNAWYRDGVPQRLLRAVDERFPAPASNTEN